MEGSIMKKNNTTIQELGMTNKINLCDSCCQIFPKCTHEHIIFGDGLGDDNICCCDIYVHVTCTGRNKKTKEKMSLQEFTDSSFQAVALEILQDALGEDPFIIKTSSAIMEISEVLKKHYNQ